MAGSKKDTTNLSETKRQRKPTLKLGGTVERTRATSGGKKKTAAGTTTKSRQSRQPRATAAQPPVMARGYQMEIPFQAGRPYTRKTRRRIDVPLSVPGAEIRLPSIPKVRLTGRLIFSILLLGLLGGMVLLWQSPLFRIEAPEILGNQQVKASDINAALGVSGKPILLIRTAALVEKLQNDFPEFSSVSIRIVLPNTLKVRVKERTPVLTWQQGQNVQLVDDNGYAFPFRLAPTMVVTPVVEAIGTVALPGLSVPEIAQLSTNGELGDKAEKKGSIEPLLKPELVAAILRVSQVVPANASLIYDAQHGIGWRDEQGWQVYLGDDTHIDMKLQTYEAIVNRLDAEDILPSLISIEHVHNPYFRAED